jgi:hypothetical protein
MKVKMVETAVLHLAMQQAYPFSIDFRMFDHLSRRVMLRIDCDGVREQWIEGLISPSMAQCCKLSS